MPGHLPTEHQYLTNDAFGTSCCFHDALQIGPNRAVLWKVFYGGVGIQDNRHENVVEFVRNTASEGADRFQALAVAELLLEAAPAYHGLFAIPDCLLNLLIEANKAALH